ncbi:hypothetical protein DZC31_06430 [Stenotrophomonas rhizophila]|nr:hypothetical protein DZC31_06430 [Stenotrophomonas rhizophila]
MALASLSPGARSIRLATTSPAASRRPLTLTGSPGRSPSATRAPAARRTGWPMTRSGPEAFGSAVSGPS